MVQKVQWRRCVFTLAALAFRMVMSCWAITDSTSMSMRLNSSKQHQAPDWASPLKKRPIICKTAGIGLVKNSKGITAHWGRSPWRIISFCKFVFSLGRPVQRAPFKVTTVSRKSEITRSSWVSPCGRGESNKALAHQITGCCDSRVCWITGLSSSNTQVSAANKKPLQTVRKWPFSL